RTTEPVFSVRCHPDASPASPKYHRRISAPGLSFSSLHLHHRDKCHLLHQRSFRQVADPSPSQDAASQCPIKGSQTHRPCRCTSRTSFPHLSFLPVDLVWSLPPPLIRVRDLVRDFRHRPGGHLIITLIVKTERDQGVDESGK